jgi:RimJ/RimL family protein N-acetyltransferase
MDDAIRTERLLLRRLRPTDAEPLFALFADWEVIHRLSTPPWPYARSDARAFIDSQINQNPPKTDFFAITLDDGLIGGIGLRMNAPPNIQRAPGPNLGYWLGRPFWNRGYMTEAARGLLAHVFDAGISKIVYSGAFAENEASLRVQTKLGFERDGETMLFSRPRGGEFLHVNTMLTVAAFRARVT